MLFLRKLFKCKKYIFSLIADKNILLERGDYTYKNLSCIILVIDMVFRCIVGWLFYHILGVPGLSSAYELKQKEMA